MSAATAQPQGATPETAADVNGASSPASPTPGRSDVSDAIKKAPTHAAARLIMQDMTRRILEGENVQGDATPPSPEAPPAEPPSAAEPEAPPVDTPPGDDHPLAEEPDDLPDPAGLSPKVQKRIDRLTAQKAELREQLEAERSQRQAMESELTELRSQGALPKPAGPTVPAHIEQLQSEDDLARYATGARDLLKKIDRFERNAMRDQDKAQFQAWLKSNGLFNEETGEVDAAGLYDLRETAEQTVNQDVPIRLQQIRQTAQFDPFVSHKYPWMKDRNSQEFRTFQRLEAQYPELKRSPAWKIILATIATNVASVLEEFETFRNKPSAAALAANGNGAAKPNGKPTIKPPTPAPKVPTVPAIAPAVVQSRGTELSALRDKAFKPGATREDRQALIRAHLTGVP
jgi:hypothetical protein